MKLSEIKKELKKLKSIAFKLPNDSFIPHNFHITDVGKVTKNFIDCGGVFRSVEVVNFQLWATDDYDHRLAPEKLINIIELLEEKMQIDDLEIEVEYQMQETVGSYNLSFDGTHFVLISRLTDCLAKDKCIVPETKTNFELGEWKVKENTCAPNSGCC
ncbi:DUF6428 family protein [uncultured Flavobacterium sp.]|mgnify:CR=1 FL=1|uniref:DUF6428 family protein n=1 Tax=uncultured Flavobacterium sp. TaxID=165435 RepID=UPI0030CA52E9|tara:strand:- start:363 stop:836 length:474 start_codon:yes stop_codon:yes gene_type:complete